MTLRTSIPVPVSYSLQKKMCCLSCSHTCVVLLCCVCVCGAFVSGCLCLLCCICSRQEVEGGEGGEGSEGGEEGGEDGSEGGENDEDAYAEGGA